MPQRCEVVIIPMLAPSLMVYPSCVTQSPRRGGGSWQPCSRPIRRFTGKEACASVYFKTPARSCSSLTSFKENSLANGLKKRSSDLLLHADLKPCFVESQFTDQHESQLRFIREKQGSYLCARYLCLPSAVWYHKDKKYLFSKRVFF